MELLMKLAFFIALICTQTIFFCFSSTRISPQRIPVAADSNLFLPVVNKTIILRGLAPDPKLFGDLEKNTKEVNRVRKIPITYLAPFGLQEGMVVQYIEEDGISHSYKLNKLVDVLLIHKDPMDMNAKIQPYWSRFNLIITDDIKHLKSLAAEKEDFLIPRGIAYLGTSKTLQTSKPENISTKKIEVKDPIYSVFNKIGEIVRSAEVFRNKFYFQPNKSEVDDGIRVTTIIKTNESMFYRITSNNDLLNGDYSYLTLDSWIKGYKTKLYKDPYNDDSCLELLLISANNVEEVQMRCKLQDDLSH